MSLEPKAWTATLYKSILKSLLMRYTIEQRMSSTFTSLSISAFFCISTLVVSCQNAAFKDMSTTLESYNRLILIFGSLHLAVCLILQLTCLCSAIMDRPPNVDHYRISIYMTVSFVYIVYPLMIWAYSSLICAVVRKEQTLLFLALATVLVALATLLCAVELATRNNVPSRFQLSAISRRTEIGIYFSCMIAICLSKVIYISQNTSTITAFLIVYDILMAFFLINLSLRPMFWEPTMHRYYLFGYATFYLSKMIAEFFNSNQATLFISMFLLGTITFKLSGLAIFRILKVDIHDKKLSDFQRYYGGLMMYAYLSDSRSESNTCSDKEIYMHYMGVWCIEKYGKWKPGAFRRANYGICDAELFDFLVRYFGESDKMDLLSMKALLKLQLLKNLPTLKDLREILFKFEVRKNKAGFLDKLELYHYRKLYERKLEAIYKGRIFPDIKKGQALNFFAIYDHMLLAYNDSVKNEEYLDINSVFTYTEVSKVAGELIKKELDNRAKIFQSILKAKVHSGKQLYVANEECLRTHSRILQIYNSHHLQPSSPPTYQYAVFLYYFSCVRHSHLTAATIMKSYKLRLNSIANISSHNKLSGDSNTVTLQIDLSAENCGTIIAASLNYFEFLGCTQSGSAEGRDLHELLPEEFSKKHKQAMAAFAGQAALAGHPEEIFLLGFDGILKNAKIVVKVLPSIKKNVAAVTQLSFNKDPFGSLVLVDSQMGIINAEKDFWEYFDMVDTNEKLHNLNQLSKSINLSLYMVNKLPKLQELVSVRKKESTSGNNSDSTLLNDKFTDTAIRVMKELSDANKREGASYAFDKTSEYYEKSIRERFVARHCYYETLGMSIIKVFIKVPSNNKKKTKNISRTVVNEPKDRVMRSPMKKMSSSSNSSNSSKSQMESYDAQSHEVEALVDFEKIIRPASKLIAKWKNHQLSQLISPADMLDIESMAKGEIRKLESLQVNEVFEAVMNVCVKDDVKQLFIEKSVALFNSKLVDDTPRHPPVKVKDKSFLRSPTKADKMMKKAAQVKSFKAFSKDDTQPVDSFVTHNLNVTDRRPVRQNALSPRSQAEQAYEERENKRAEQERLADTANIVIASSNSIAKILNKVMVDMN